MRWRFGLVAVMATILALGSVAPASADREHTVRSGQTLSGIARRYGLSAEALARANGLRPNAPLRIGQVLVIPTGPAITVRPGDTMGGLARRHGVSVADLARINGLRTTSRLRAGQTLYLPGTGGGGDEPAAPEWGRPRQPGVVSFSRLGTRESYRGRLVDARGRARPDARNRLMRLMRDDDGGVRAPNPRLLAVLTRVSDHFGGRRIHIISGYRQAGGYTRETSRHTRGDAMDLRIDGVPITAIRDYCRTLPNVGCGYYPRSRFVHIDVRDRATYWIDWSGPGEAPQYRRPEGATEPGDDGTAPDDEGRRAAEDEAGEGGAAPEAAPPAAPAPAP